MATIRVRGEHQVQAEVRRKGYPARTKTFETRKAAEQWARQVESEMDRGVFVNLAEAERTTFAEALERYGREISAMKRHPKQEQYRINQWLRHPLAHRTLTSLRGIDFAKYRDDRRKQGRAENTIRLELALVGNLFNIARVEWGMEGLPNPLNNIRKPSGSNARDRRLVGDEYDRLIDALSKARNQWVAPAFKLAIETGLRQGILVKIRWNWVDLPGRVIHIPIEFRRVSNKCVPAAVPLSTRALAVLNALPKTEEGLVFQTTANALWQVWDRARKKLGIEDLRWHDLRHEGTSCMFELGLNPIEVASITGHKSLSMLKRYTHLNPSDLAAKLG